MIDFYSKLNTSLKLKTKRMGFEIKNEGGDRTLIDEGSYPCALVHIVDCGTQTSKLYGDSRKLALGFYAADLTGTDEKGKQVDLDDQIRYRTLPAKLTKKSDLGKLLKKWQGIVVEKGETFDLDELLGQEGMLNIVHSDEDDDGNIWDNIDSVTRLPKSTKGPKVPKKIDVMSLYLDETFDKDFFDTLPDFLKEKIQKTPEYKALGKGKSKGKARDDEEEEEEDERPAKRTSRKKVEDEDEDEDETPKRGRKKVADDEEEEEEEKPSRRKRPADDDEDEEEEKPKGKKGKKVVEEEDEEEEEAPRRRKRPAVEEEEEEEVKPRRSRR
jgi:hypothetical protein